VLKGPVESLAQHFEEMVWVALEFFQVTSQVQCMSCLPEFSKQSVLVLVDAVT
jgi:hypothetical protein